MAKTWAMILGWIFLLIGILGFIGNPIIGAHGYFAANMAHNIVHIIFGIVLLWVAYGAAMKSASALKWIGILCLILAIVGFLSSSGSFVGITLNAADNWLDLILGIILVWVGIAAGKKGSMPSSQASQQM